MFKSYQIFPRCYIPIFDGLVSVDGDVSVDDGIAVDGGVHHDGDYDVGGGEEND